MGLQSRVRSVRRTQVRHLVETLSRGQVLDVVVQLCHELVIFDLHGIDVDVACPQLVTVVDQLVVR